MNFIKAVLSNLNEISGLVNSNYPVSLPEADSYQVQEYNENTKEIRFSVSIDILLNREKEKLYIELIKNLYRRLDFMVLMQALDNGEITEEEFDQELKEHEDRYLIPAPSKAPSLSQLLQIADIVKKINRVDKMSVDEVSEAFSLDLSNAEEIINNSVKKREFATDND